MVNSWESLIQCSQKQIITDMKERPIIAYDYEVIRCKKCSIGIATKTHKNWKQKHHCDKFCIKCSSRELSSNVEGYFYNKYGEKANLYLRASSL